MRDRLANLIKSSRTFGVEIEVGDRTADTASRVRQNHRSFNTAHDGSIQAPNGYEIVSQVLKGKDGAKKVFDLTQTMKDLDLITDDQSCGLHVHLGAKDFLPNKKWIAVAKDGIDSFIAKYKKPEALAFIAESAIRDFRTANIDIADNEELNEADYLNFGSQISVKSHDMWNLDRRRAIVGVARKLGEITYRKIGGVNRLSYDYLMLNTERKVQKLEDSATERRSKEYSNALKAVEGEKMDKIEKLIDHCKEGMWLARIEDPKAFDKLKALLCFYLTFNSVFTGMVSPSRTRGNSYCVPIEDYFNREDIANAASVLELEQLWYKTERPDGRKQNHRDSSRYVDFNFHSVFSRYNTLEVRSHGSTKSPNQILFWTALHQHIMDMISDGNVSIEDIMSISQEDTVEEKINYMARILQLPEHLERYVRRAVNHFNQPN